jgi:carboxyl-terminal processing protease
MLSDGSELRLTIARYYTPLGRSIQKPYNNGREAYDEEVIERFHNGEALHGDTSTSHPGHVYKTPAGRLVYGGGGITPDVFVGFDTNRLSKSITALYVNGSLGNYIYEYYIHHLPEFRTYKDAADFSARFNRDDELWQGLSNYVKKDSISLNTMPAADKALLRTRIRALLARLAWRSEGYFMLMNQTDPVIKKALELLNNNTPMPSAAKPH